MSTTIEKHEFQAETKELLQLMIHSIYSNKDIFLRELISNSSDAIDKRQFEAISQAALLPEGYSPQIFLEADPSARTLTIHDNGIGMSRDEVIRLIGTIAKSGTREFISVLKEQQSKQGVIAPDLIGQFGVGFYATFIVAEEVTLLTQKAGETEATRWVSTGDGTYSIEPAAREMPGTSITLKLKAVDTEDGMKDYTDPWVLRQIVKQYSDFVGYPIQMDIEREEVPRDTEGKPIPDAKPEKTLQRETLNSMKAIWTRPESEVPAEELDEFYRHIAHDWQAPQKSIRLKVEGTFEAQALLFIPQKAPMDLFYRDAAHGIQLYVKRVFIMDDCKELIPPYLRFVKGVVDSEDLSLNISREILQQDRQIRAIRKKIVKKVLSTLENMKQDEKEQYNAFWQEFGRALKEGLLDDFDQQKTLLDLALFRSTTTPDSESVSLAEYVSRMKADQKAIYFMTGPSTQQILNSPHLEIFKEKGYEVLLLTDPVDEVWTQSVTQFGETSFQSVGKGTVELGSETERKDAEEKREAKEKELQGLLSSMQQELDSTVKEVRLSTRLTNSAACLVGNPSDITPQMEQLLKAMNQPVPPTKRILELNAAHPLIEKLQQVQQTDANDPRLKEFTQLLYGQALLAEGGALPDPAAFSQLVAKLMTQSL